MRTRQRELNLEHSIDLAASNYELFWYNEDGSTGYNLTQPHGAKAPFPVDQINEIITDTVGSRKTSNSVIHRRQLQRLKTSPSTTGIMVASSGPNGQYGQFEYTGSGAAYRGLDLALLGKQYAGTWDFSPEADVVPPPGLRYGTQGKSHSAMIEDCFEKARQLQADVLLNLLETPSLYSSLASSARSLPKLADQWRMIRTYVGTASAAYLMWRFGIAPLVQDMRSAVASLKTLEAKLQRWLAMSTYRYSSVTRMNLVPDSLGDHRIGVRQRYSAYSPAIVYYGIEDRLSWETNEPCTVRYVLKVRPKTELVLGLLAEARQVHRMYSTSLATLAWELVPWSFVVDWFVDMRGLLRKIDYLTGQEPFEIVGFTRSVSYRVTKTIDYKEYRGGVLVDIPELSKTEYKFYERQHVSTAATKPSWRPRFGKSQAAITAALISQQLSAAKLARIGARVFL